MGKLVSIVLNELSLFKSHHGGIKEVIDITNPTDKCIVIDGLPNKDKCTYCIHTKEGWVVFSKEYTNDDLVYPSIYGILSRKLDIDVFASASVHGIDVKDIDDLFED